MAGFASIWVRDIAARSQPSARRAVWMLWHATAGRALFVWHSQRRPVGIPAGAWDELADVSADIRLGLRHSELQLDGSLADGSFHRWLPWWDWRSLRSPCGPNEQPVDGRL